VKIGERARLIAAWMTGHQDRDALKQDLEAADIAWAEIREAGEALRSQQAAGRDLVIAVGDADGSIRQVVRMPYCFSDAASGPPRGVPNVGATDPGEILSEWAGNSVPPRRSYDTR
jgi:crotonobetainyl-CoA:carnitine CoA-transferase CaiB-like acyl-CoA transferase